jgi:hypothetical protein
MLYNPLQNASQLPLPLTPPACFEGGRGKGEGEEMGLGLKQGCLLWWLWSYFTLPYLAQHSPRGCRQGKAIPSFEQQSRYLWRGRLWLISRHLQSSPDIRILCEGGLSLIKQQPQDIFSNTSAPPIPQPLYDSISIIKYKESPILFVPQDTRDQPEKSRFLRRKKFIFQLKKIPFRLSS